MRRVVVLAATAVALCSAPAGAQPMRDGVAGESRGSTGPTFPNPGPETLIAAAPAPGGTSAGPDSPVAPATVDCEVDVSGRLLGKPDAPDAGR